MTHVELACLPRRGYGAEGQESGAIFDDDFGNLFLGGVYMSAHFQQVSIIGTGVIGSGWAARCLAAGLNVRAFDPSADGEAKLRTIIDNAWPSLVRRGIAANASPERLQYARSVSDCVGDADFIQESAPEREPLKQALLAEIDRSARPEAIIASSTSGLLPTRLQALCHFPHRVLVGHPFNPVYLLPLVEVVAGEKTSAKAITDAASFYRSIGMRPLHVRREIEGFIADRLMEALWREALWLIADGVATTEEIDAAVVYGCGLRWSLMGTFLTFHLAGGDAGMRHMLHQFGPALKLPWTKLVAPELTDELINQVVAGCEHQAAGRAIKALERRRDDFLVELLALVQRYWPESEGISDRI
jgi:carnitine 3-dehydrogenase